MHDLLPLRFRDRNFRHGYLGLWSSHIDHGDYYYSRDWMTEELRVPPDENRTMSHRSRSHSYSWCAYDVKHNIAPREWADFRSSQLTLQDKSQHFLEADSAYIR